MAEMDKSLGLHQRIPMDILFEAVRADLSGEADSVRMGELVRSEYVGENRQKKGVRQIKTTLTVNPVMDFCREHKEEVLAALKSTDDRNLILSAIVAGRYHFCYDVFCFLAKQFRLQDYVSTDLLLRLVGAKYCANKSVYNIQINAVAQMVEAGLIRRVKTGVYEAAEALRPVHRITAQVWKEGYFANEPLSGREDEEMLMYEPYFKYIRL